MRNDFDGHFFQIEFMGYRGGNPSCPKEWLTASLDHFGTPGPQTGHTSFSASGACWQRTGHHGTFDRETGEKAVMEIALENPGHKFRLVRRTVVWKTEEALVVEKNDILNP